MLARPSQKAVGAATSSAGSRLSRAATLMETYSLGFHSEVGTQPYGMTPQCLQKPVWPVAAPGL